MMEEKLAVMQPGTAVKATLRFGSEVFPIESESGLLSDQLVAVKEKSMSILKQYITKHNVPNDVDEPLDGTSDGESDELDNPPKKSKK